jgi:hypothetical protein
LRPTKSLSEHTGMRGAGDDVKSVKWLHAQRVALAATQPVPVNDCVMASHAQA